MSVRVEEGWFLPDASIRLYTKDWIPPAGTEIRARLAFVHGFSDHCNAYYNLFPSLAARGIAVYAFDQRGWGRSVSKKSQRGDTGPTKTVLADIRSFLNHLAARSAPDDGPQDLVSTPLFLMGHSMGGAEVLLLALLQSQPQPLPHVSGILVESPFAALHPSGQPSVVTIVAGKLASKVLPKRQMIQKLAAKYLSRDPQVCRDWEEDELCHDTGTLEGLTGMLQRAADLTAVASGQPVDGLGLKTRFGTDQPLSDTTPIWLGHGTDDHVTNCPTTEALFGKLDVKDKTFKSYPGAYHKLHAEPDGVADEFTNDVANWILERTADGKRESGQGRDTKPRL